MARIYGAAAIFGCYLSIFRYVRLAVYLQSLSVSNIFICSQRDRVDVYVLSQEHSLSPSLLMTIS